MNSRAPTSLGIRVGDFRERFRKGRILDVSGDVLPRQHSTSNEQRRRLRQRLTKEWKDADRKAVQLARVYEDATKAGNVRAAELASMLGEAQGAAEREQFAREALERAQRAR